LSWIPIHQVAMHHDPCFCKVAGHLATCSTVTPYLSISTNGLRLLQDHQKPAGSFSNKHKSLKTFFRSEY
jgi:hypothetical protein